MAFGSGEDGRVQWDTEPLEYGRFGGSSSSSDAPEENALPGMPEVMTFLDGRIENLFYQIIGS